MNQNNKNSDTTLMTLAELREHVQAPVREANDIGGVLWGDWLSPPVTLLFLKLDLSPTVATIGMLVVGVTGCALIVPGGVYSVFGAALVILFYILDCVDGEVARYRKQEKFFWSYADFFFGMWVMSLFYIAVGVQAAIQTGISWLGLLGVGCVLFFLTKKFIDVVHIFLTIQHVVLGKERIAQKYRQELTRDIVPLPERGKSADNRDCGEEAGVITRADVVSKYGGWLGILRGAVMNFHISAAIFFVLSLVDLLIPEIGVFGVSMNLKTLFIAAYFCLLLFNAMDYFVDGMRGGFMRKSRELLRNLEK